MSKYAFGCGLFIVGSISAKATTFPVALTVIVFGWVLMVVLDAWFETKNAFLPPEADE